ncbi:MAG: ATP-dependent DNA helicase, partial [Candidatus Phytoplasma stylosanthis]|nr:ATP-dependent DNA helicase [Candidatus Phytoplasma stylosanthis]
MIDFSLQKLFIESNLYPKLIKNDIKNIKELIFKKPKKYENFTLSQLSIIHDKEKVNLFGIIITNPIPYKIFFKKKAKILKILTKENIIFKIIFFNNFFFNLLKINQKIFVKGTYYQKYNSIFASFISKANIK